MKKILIGVVITIVVLVGGFIALVGGAANSVSNTMNDMEQETISEDKLYAEMASGIQWQVEKSTYSSKIVGIFENTSAKEIDYIQFDYKLLDASGVTITSSFTNETKIVPGEKRKVEILLGSHDFSTYDITVKSTAF